MNCERTKRTARSAGRLCRLSRPFNGFAVLFCSLLLAASPDEVSPRELAHKPVLHVYYDLASENDNGARFRLAYESAVPANRPTLVSLRLPLAVDGKRVRSLPVSFDDYSVVVATSEALARSVRLTAPSVPLVFLTHSDPRSSGLIDSYARPGNNATGFTFFADVAAKRFELMRELVPEVKTVGVLIDRGATFNSDFVESIHAAAAAAGVRAQIVVCDDWRHAVRELHNSRNLGIDAWDFPATHLAELHAKELVALVRELRLPAQYPNARFVREGGYVSFFAYGVKSDETLARAVALILKGAAPGDIPFESPRSAGFVVNVEAGRRMGLSFSDSVLARAARVYR